MGIYGDIGGIYVGTNSDLRVQLVQHMHESSIGGHSGVATTYNRMHMVFLWSGMIIMVKEWVLACHVCLINKLEHVRLSGLL